MLFDQLQVSRYFSKIDIRSGYHQLRVHGEDILKTAIKTRYGHFEFTVMPVGVNQCTNDFHGLDEPGGLRGSFEVSVGAEEEGEVVCLVSKYEFWLQEVRFLRHVVNSNDIHVDSSYYQCFIANFSKIAKPLASLTQKNQKYEWGREQEEAFQTLKDNLCNTPILSLPDGPEEFVVYCDASNQGLGCVLMQRGYDKILAAPSEASKVENATAEMLHSLLMGKKEDEVDRLTKSAYFLEIREDYKMEKLVRLYINEKALGTRLDMSTANHPLTDGQSERTIQTLEDMLREKRLIGPELVQEMTDKVVLIKEKLKVARERQKSYADNRHKLLEFEVGNQVLLKVSP
nr:hypothetical protein [Tanacetum cinerariifolium]